MANMFSHTVGSLCNLVLFSLAMQKLFILMRSNLFILFFMSRALGDISVKILLYGISEIFLPMFSSRTFMVLWFIFKSIIHLEFICIWCKSVAEFHVFACCCPDLTTPVYSILCFCPLCQILIDHRDLGLFLGSLFYSTDLCVCSYASTRLFWLLRSYNIVDIRYCDPSYFVFLSQNCYRYSGPFMVPYKVLKC